MGYDVSCTMKYGGKTTRGTAWLEHKDLIFRGPTRLAIPLGSISSAVAHDGTLVVTFGKEAAEFGIGDAAEKWAKRITSPPSRLDKLGIKEGLSIAAVDLSDRDFLDEAAARSAHVTRTVPKTGKPVDLIFYGAEHRDALSRLPVLSKLIKEDGAIWIVRPKGRLEITEAETMAAGKRAGLVDVKVVSFSETHTAEKFVIPVARRKKPAK